VNLIICNGLLKRALDLFALRLSPAGTGPTPVPEQGIEAIRSALYSRLLVESPTPFVSIGDWARVKAGPQSKGDTLRISLGPTGWSMVKCPRPPTLKGA